MPQSPMTTLGTAASMSTSVPIGRADRRRRELAEEEADRDRERRREQHRAERRDDRADDQVARAVTRSAARSSRCARRTRARRALIAGHAPSATRQMIAKTTSDAERARRARSGRRAGRRRCGRRRGACARRPVGSERRRLPRGQHSSRRAAPRGPVTTSSHDVHILCTPAVRAPGETPRACRASIRALHDRAARAPPRRRRRRARDDGVRHRRPVRLLRQGAGGQGRHARHLQERDHRADRAVGLRQVDRSCAA